MKKKKVYIIIFLILIGIILFSILIVGNKINDSILHSDEIQITAKLREDDFAIHSGKQTIKKDLELNITVNNLKDAKGSLTLYPIINNANRLSFNSYEENNYYQPSSIGGSGFLNARVEEILRNENIESNNIDLSLFAIPISGEKGVLYLRAYMNKKNDSIELNNPVLVCLYNIEIFGFDFLWHKVIPIELEK
ncbi:hypothetical protein [Lachnoclostridium sp.]|uniref:hypothetical protein n=1 Tax=Lachnoclostridium sp. TaxID=2028282 RepID=UPI0028A0AFF8|nr:hypothetical protein [Lachnoclostridium sp.]